MGHQCAVGSVDDGGNTQIRPGVAAVQVEATNFAAIVRPERAAQCGHAGEEQQRLGGAARGANQGVGL